MWLVTGVLKESTGRGSPSADALFEGTDSSPQVAAALQSLKTLVTFSSNWARQARNIHLWCDKNSITMAGVNLWWMTKKLKDQSKLHVFQLKLQVAQNFKKNSKKLRRLVVHDK
jgi:hypothetical protein